VEELTTIPFREITGVLPAAKLDAGSQNKKIDAAMTALHSAITSSLRWGKIVQAKIWGIQTLCT
jgi:hypothetical protein